MTLHDARVSPGTDRLALEPARSGLAATQRVFATLLQRILTFDLKPFNEISEGGLAEQMNVSRTPVREALARLAKLQLVDIYPQRGTVIAPLRVADLKRSQFMRESLEWGLLRRALRSPERANSSARSGLRQASNARWRASVMKRASTRPTNCSTAASHLPRACLISGRTYRTQSYTWIGFVI